MATRIMGKDSNSGLTIIYYTLIVRFIFYIACIIQGKILIGLMTFELMLLPFEIIAIRLIASDLSQIVKKLQDLSKNKSTSCNVWLPPPSMGSKLSKEPDGNHKTTSET